jgi:hypothetical protein
MVEKAKETPVPDRKQADAKPTDTRAAEPKFVRGVIDPPTKKKG